MEINLDGSLELRRLGLATMIDIRQTLGTGRRSVYAAQTPRSLGHTKALQVASSFVVWKKLQAKGSTAPPSA
jgi:hypothetical protein